MKKNQGFTLIELLVVIAIIGILASVVLASLNSARNKGADAAVKSNLANARAQAEIFYDSNGNTYNPGNYNASTTATNVCASVALAGGVSGIYKQVQAAAKAAGVVNGTVSYVGASNSNAVCLAAGQKWVATAPLKNPTITNGIYCVDASGFSGEVVNTNVTTLSLACN